MKLNGTLEPCVSRSWELQEGTVERVLDELPCEGRCPELGACFMQSL